MDMTFTLAAVLWILVIAIPLALLTSVVSLYLYRRAVLRAMRSHTHGELAEASVLEASASSRESVQIPLEIAVIDSTPISSQKSAGGELHSDLLRRPWRTAGIYAIAGACYALVTTVIFLSATPTEFHILTFLAIFWYYAWPVVVTACIVAAATWQTRLTLFGVYFLMIIVLGAVDTMSSSSSDWNGILVLWLLTNLPAVLVLLVFLNRRIQAVGPLVLTFMIFAVTGSILLPGIVNSNMNLQRPVINMAVMFGLDAGSILIGLRLAGLVLFGALGWLVVQGIATLYRRKKVSVQSITIDSIWLLFGIFQSVGLLSQGERWFLISLLAFFVYKIVAWAGFSIAGRHALSTHKHPNLLLLRVFSLGKRSERLFDLLGMYWRYAGSIRLITGPDLAIATVEPHEFLDFLSGNISRQFIENSQTLDLRIAELDSEPDFDGQFRVNDFFCYDDTWRMVLSRLVGETDVVVMDLRGFSSQNTGVIFEINELVNMIPLARVLFIIDETTDEAFLRQALQQSWEQMKPTSPNRQWTSGLLHLFRWKGLRDLELQGLLHALSMTANAAPQI
jgi:hypothetical protein